METFIMSYNVSTGEEVGSFFLYEPCSLHGTRDACILVCTRSGGNHQPVLPRLLAALLEPGAKQNMWS